MTNWIGHASNAVGEGFIFQDDNASPHRGRIVTEYLNEQGIEHMDWPAVSPDMSPIEHVWDQLGRKATDRLTPDSTLDELQHILVEEWQRLPQQNINKLVNQISMPWVHYK